MSLVSEPGGQHVGNAGRHVAVAQNPLLQEFGGRAAAAEHGRAAIQSWQVSTERYVKAAVTLVIGNQRASRPQCLEVLDQLRRADPDRALSDVISAPYDVGAAEGFQLIGPGHSRMTLRNPGGRSEIK